MTVASAFNPVDGAPSERPIHWTLREHPAGARARTRVAQTPELGGVRGR